MIHFILVYVWLYVVFLFQNNVSGACVNKTCESYVHLSSEPDPLIEVKALNIAILSAGGVRSFAFNERSWRRYLIDPWKSSNIHVFSHLTSPKRNCELYEKGIEAMKNLATEVEISYAHTPLLSHADVRSKFGRFKSCLSKMNSDQLTAGNIIDMHARRQRAYEMAMHYSKVHRFHWHIMMFVRMDSAFYSPKIEFYKIFKGLQNHTAITGRNVLIIPPGCSFGHICDRSAIGLAKDMAVYFNASMLPTIAEWSHTVNANDPPKQVEDKKTVRELYECSGERMMQIWLEYINNYEVTDTMPPAQSFITQRCLTANTYCSLPRNEFKQKRIARWGDKTTIRWTPVAGFDYSDNAEERCGPIYTMNTTEVCMRPECECGRKN